MTARRSCKENGLSLFFLALFLFALVGQACAGHAQYNNEEVTQGLEPISLGRYLTSSSFAADVAENWQSEYLQFLLFVLATIWLVQRGSPESKRVELAGKETDEQQLVGDFAKSDSPTWVKAGGWRSAIFSRSLGLVMGSIFFTSWLAQSAAGWTSFNETQLGNLEEPYTWWGYVTSADFWNRTLQNWQSEFLAVGSFVVLAVYLRQGSSGQSKPVGAPHAETSVES